MSKQYDRGYFDRWYRAPGAIVRPEVTARKARLALAAAEHLLGREVRSVLDVGCGEAPWRATLKRARPRLDYVGIDPSAYAVRRFGRRRDVRSGSLAELGRVSLRRRFDLVICADVLQYVPTPELRSGLRNIHDLLGGLAYLEAFSSEDDMIGDGVAWHHRSAAQYRREFRRARLVACGLPCYIPARMRHAANVLELLED